MRPKFVLSVLLLALGIAVAVTVTGQEEPLSTVHSRLFSVEPASLTLAVEPARRVAQTSIADAVRNSDYVTFEALYQETKPAEYRALHDLWTWSMNDPTGAFYGRELHDTLARAYPGYTRFIERYRITDSHSNVFYPTSETRTFLLDRALEKEGPRVQFAEALPETTLPPVHANRGATASSKSTAATKSASPKVAAADATTASANRSASHESTRATTSTHRTTATQPVSKTHSATPRSSSVPPHASTPQKASSTAVKEAVAPKKSSATNTQVAPAKTSSATSTQRPAAKSTEPAAPATSSTTTAPVVANNNVPTTPTTTPAATDTNAASPQTTLPATTSASTPEASPATASTPAPVTNPTQPEVTRTPSSGILLLVIGLIGVGLLAVILRTPKEAQPTSIIHPAAADSAPPTNDAAKDAPVEPIRRQGSPGSATPGSGESKKPRATGSHG